MTSSRSGKEARRAELLQIARTIFAEKGYEATTISEIVARAGIAQGTFYWYFSSKASLAHVLESEIQERIQEALLTAYQEATHLEEMIDRSVQEAFRVLGDYRDVLAIINSNTRWLEKPSERERTFAPYYTLIAELLRREQEQGRVHASITPDVTAILIVGTVYYAAVECYIYHSPVTPDMYIAEASQFIRRALGLS